MGTDGRCPGCGAVRAAAGCVVCFARQFAPAAAADLPRLPGLEVHERLGRGGFGTVYAAYDTRRNRRVAVKLLHPDLAADPVHRGRFRREFDAVEQLRRKGIVAVFGFDEDADRAWFVMELIDGPSLARVFDEPLPPGDVVRLLRPVADALGYAHDRNICHLDLSPANVLLDADGQPVVVDFGLAVGLRERLPLVRAAVHGYTPHYTAPEFRGAPNPDARRDRADVYSFGAVLYRGLTGTDPPAEVAPAALEFPPAVSRDLQAVCRKCLDPDPDRRYPRMADVGGDLDRVAADRPVLARPLGPVARAGRWVRRNPGWTVLVALVLFGVGVGVYQWRQRAAVEKQDRERSERAEAERVARLTGEAADAAFRSGRWGAAAALSAEAVARGHPEAARFAVRRLRALFAAGRVAEVESELRAAPDEDDHRGQRLLLRAELAFLAPTQTEAARELVRQALATPGLDTADAAYARGLLADSAPEMLARFEEAVGRDSTHYPSQAALAVGLMVTGRYADARTRIRFVRGLFPDDPLADYAEGLTDLLDGRTAAGLERLEQVADRTAGPRGERLRSHARQLAERLTALRGLNARAGMGANVMLGEKGANDRAALADNLARMFSPDGLPVGVPSPVVARLFEPGLAYIRAVQILVTEFDPVKAAATAETALAQDPDASLASLACAVRFLTAAKLYPAKTPKDRQRLEAEMRRIVELGELATTCPSRYAGGSFRYEGRVYAVFALACLAQADEFPEASKEFRPRLWAALPRMVAEGAEFPQMRRDAVTALVGTGTLDPAEWRAVLSAWIGADRAEPAPWELLAAKEWQAGNAAAARDVAARAAAAFPADTALKTRLDKLMSPARPIPPAKP